MDGAWLAATVGSPAEAGSGHSGRVVTSLRLELRPSIPECERSVEHERIGRGVRIGTEVAEALELHGLADRNLCE
jgi:hypothetical protein